MNHIITAVFRTLTLTLPSLAGETTMTVAITATPVCKPITRAVWHWNAMAGRVFY